MKQTFTNSLIVKLSIMVILIESLGLAAIGIYYQHRFAAEIDTRIETQIQIPGILMKRQLLRYESVADREMLSELVGEVLIDAMVIGADHKIFYALHAADEGQDINTIPGFDPRWLDPPPTAPMVVQQSSGERTFLVSITPLAASHHAEPFFFVYLKVNSSSSEKQKTTIAWLLTVGSLLCILLTSTGLILGLRTIITDPLRQLEENTRQIAQGDFHQTITIHRADELGRLAHSFLHMRDTIRQNMAELQEFNRSLEQKVEERTEELQENMLLLQQEIIERRLIEEVLHTERDNLRSIMASMPTSLLVFDHAEQVIDANPAALRLFGRKPDDFKGRRCGEILGCALLHQYSSGCGTTPSCSDCELNSVLKNVLSSNQGVYNQEARMLIETHAGPESRWFSFSIETMQINGQRRAILSLDDITARKQAEQQLAAQQKLLQSVADMIPDIVYLYHVQQQCHLYINKEMASLLGYSSEELKTRGAELILSHIHPDDLPQVTQHTDIVAHTQRDAIFELEYRIQNKEGNYLWFYVREQVYQRDEAGHPEIVFGICQDITRRKHAEHALQENERYLKRAEQMGRVGHWNWDTVTNTLIWSEELYRIFGVERKFELTYQGIENMIHPEDRSHNKQKVNELLATAGTTVFEFRIIRPDGNIRWIYQLAEVTRTVNGQPVSFFGIMQDITERKQAEEQIKSALKEKEVLLREIHHRVKNNLMVVSSLIQMQAEETSDAEALNLFRDLYHRVMAMSMVHEDLYQSGLLSQIEFGVYLQRLVINIRQGFAQARAAIKVSADDIFLSVHKAIPCGLIVTELVTNAFKYAFPSECRQEDRDERLEIHIKMSYDAPTYTLIVSDNGVGLPPDFDIQKSNSLGMALVHSWVSHQLKGKITVESPPGTTFTITFTESR